MPTLTPSLPWDPSLGPFLGTLVENLPLICTRTFTYFSRSMDVESGPDADTPRPIGVGLLLCMLERGGDDVVIALLQLAQKNQVGTCMQKN